MYFDGTKMGGVGHERVVTWRNEQSTDGKSLAFPYSFRNSYAEGQTGR